MTLFSTIQLSKNALFSSQLGIEVTANNIANTDTPGYVRERLILTPGPAQTIGRIVTGTGVNVQGVVRTVDSFLQQRLWTAASDVANGEAQEAIYVSLESAIGELTENDLSTALTNFFNSVSDVLNQPESQAVRNLAVLQGDALASQIRRMDGRVRELRDMTNARVVNAASQINQLVADIGKLNNQIINTEQGGKIFSDAVGLRDKREKALEDLSKIVDIQVEEQTSGAVNVFVGGNYLVFDGTTQSITVAKELDRGLPIAELRMSKSDSLLRASSGELAGLMTARDGILGEYLDDLSEFAETLIFEFNKIHASGQGQSAYTEALGEYSVDDRRAPLDEAGLDFTPVHGSFQVTIVNTDTQIHETHDVFVQLSGLEDDTTMQDLRDSLDAIDGLSAEITVDGQLQLLSESAAIEFSFADDTSGVLAALGINTFFTGTDSARIGVHEALLADANKLAMSQGGVGQDTRNGELLADFLNRPLESRDGNSLSQIYEQWMGNTAQSAALAGAVAEGFRVFHTTLEGEHLGLTGVSLDEEAVNMITFQRSYQASARVITTIGELLDVLVNL